MPSRIAIRAWRFGAGRLVGIRNVTAFSTPATPEAQCCDRWCQAKILAAYLPIGPNAKRC
jgi:hypothetical protein